MRYLLLSDIHSNDEALAAVLARVRRKLAIGKAPVRCFVHDGAVFEADESKGRVLHIEHRHFDKMFEVAKNPRVHRRRPRLIAVFARD